MKSHSLFLKLFVSSAALLIIIVAVFIIISDYAIMNSSKSEIGQNCVSKLKVAENTVFQFKDTINREAVRLSVNSAIINLSGMTKFKADNSHNWFPDTRDLSKLFNAVNVVFETFDTNSNYYSIYLYLDDLGYSLTTNQGFISNSELIDTGWLKYYEEYKNKGTPLSWIKTRLPYNNAYRNYLPSDYVITYIFPLAPSIINLHGALVVNIKEKVISKLINTNNLDKEGYIFIIDNKGNVISHIDEQLLCKNISNIDYINDVINSPLTEGYIVTKVDGEKSLVSYYKSRPDDWIYIGIFPLEHLINNVNRIRSFTIYLSIFIVIISMIFTYLISKRLYNPVKKLIQDLKATKGINIFKGEDEMAILKKAFESLSSEIEKNKKNLRESCLYNLLKGKYSHEVLGNNIFQKDFQYPYFVCAVISIDKYESFLKQYAKNEQQYYFKMLILNIAEEIINSSYDCIGIDMDEGEIALIINVNIASTREVQDTLKIHFVKIQDEIRKILDYTISVGIGSCYSDNNQIKTSYMEAKEALKLKLIYGYGSIIPWQKELIEHKYYYPFDIETYILNQLEAKNINAVKDTVKRLITDIKDNANLSFNNIIQIFYQLVGNTVIKYLIDSNIDMNHVFSSDFNLYSQLSKKETLSDIEQWLIDVYNKIIDYCIKFNSNDKCKVNLIIEYIQKNYKKNIGIQDIADYVGLSYSYVRKIFKEEVGKNIIDYINNMRIEEAKRLLVYTNKSIRDLSIELGYNNDQSFTRLFKKIEGVTPGEYRNSNNKVS